MSNIKNKLALAAIAIFSAHTNIEEIFITSDCQGFTDEEKAKDNARYQKDKSIQKFERGFEESYTDPEDTSGKDIKNNEPTERQLNFIRYEELFGSKPANNISNDKLKAAIKEKESELKKDVDPPVPEV